MTQQTSKPRILIVDDEPRILDSLRGLLEDDFDVLSTTDPHEALDMLRNAPVLVILADQRMPKLNGDQFLSLAQEISDAARILITGYTDIKALIRAVNGGQILTYVPKPWDSRELKKTVSSAAKYSEEMANRRAAAERLAEQQEALARSEANLRHQTKLLQSILDSMGDGVLVMDETGQMVLTNPAAEQMVGDSLMETPPVERNVRHGLFLPGTEIPFPPDQLPLMRAMRGESVDGVELYIRNDVKPQGMYASINVRPLNDDFGKGRGGVAVVRDITVAKASEDLLRLAKEEAEHANRAKSEFLSRMSHELRTPLNSILGFAQLLQLADLGENNQDNVHHILKGGYHLLGLINEILDLARIEAGKLSLSAEPVLLSDVLKEAMDLVRPLALQQRVTLDTDMGAFCFDYIQADRQRLKQILLNLLANAIKFNRQGGSVSITADKCSQTRLRLTISDTGRGISKEGLRKVFTPFERLDADEAGIGGTGLGLALSKRLIEAMGGTISVESTLGVGSCFSLELTLAANPADQLDSANPEPSACDDSAVHSVQGTVLYIEDNLSNLALMEKILARYPGVKLLAAMQGKMGLDFARTNQPDWILLDIHLPDMPGDEVLGHLRADPKTEHIPVTVVSADATMSQLNRLIEGGAREYLTKPLDIRQLRDLLEATLRSRVNQPQ